MVVEQQFGGLCRYLIVQEEIGEEGTYHLQGYVEMEKEKSLLGMKTYIPNAHWEPRCGTQQQAIDYCCKLDTALGKPYIWGQPSPKKGARVDYDELKKDLMNGMTEKEASEKHFGLYLKYYKGIQSFMALHAPKKTWKCPIEVVVGEAGAGKSYWVQNSLIKDTIQYWKDGTKWWPFYEGIEESIVFDEFVGCFSPYELNRMHDPVPYAVEIKGSHKPWVAKRIIIISNYHPQSWWSKQDYWPAFERRVSEWHYCWCRTTGANKVYERKSFKDFQSFAQHLTNCNVPNKPSKEDK